MKKQNRFGTIVICLLLLSAFVLGLIGCVAVPQENGEQESLVKDGSESESVNDKEDTSKQEDTSELEDTSEPEESSDTEEPVEPIVLELLSAVDLMENVTSDQIVVSKDIKDGNVAMTDFAIRLFKAANEEGKSTLISPLSIVYALAMTANGAKGENSDRRGHRYDRGRIEPLSLLVYEFTFSGQKTQAGSGEFNMVYK